MEANDAANGVSVVTTTWNERENIEEFARQIRKVMEGLPHEIIVVDDGSPDGTFEVAERVADVAVKKVHEGQTKGLLYGVKLAKYPSIVTIDADLEADPKYIPLLVQKLQSCDLVVASRTVLPRISEKSASKILGRMVGVSDFFSNFRAYRKESAVNFELKLGETFGGELLVIAKKKGLKIDEIKFVPPPRRDKPRIGGTLRANLRISVAAWKCFFRYLRP
jgi:dolichol-phosphate mannosyltransferase